MEGSEGQPAGSEGQPAGSEGQPAGSEGQPEGGWTYVRTDGRTDGISPHSTGLHPLPGLLPKNVGQELSNVFKNFLPHL